MDKLDMLVHPKDGAAAGQAPDDGTEAWLSALFDGETDDTEAGRGLGRLARDPAATRCWAEYSLIGDVMRGNGASTGNLAVRVRAALAAEPTVLAPLPAARPSHPPYYWLAAAAAVTAVTWVVWQVAPFGPAVPVAANPPPPAAVPAGVVVAANEVTPSQVMPYLAAHQDYAYAVVSEPEMRFTRVSLQGDGR